MAHPLDDPRLDWELLRRFGFDEARFRQDQAAIAEGKLTGDTFTIRGAIAPAPGVVNLEVDDRTVREAGETALARGEVASVVLNGGMATRFGGVVKGVVEVFDGQSFIALKADDVRRASARFGARVPLVLMNSFATGEATRLHVEMAHRFGLPDVSLLHFDQSISVRMNPDGSLFIDDEGRPSYHAPGHGDFFPSIRRSGVLSRLIEQGTKYLLFSNVDNLGATVDPMIIGSHVLAGKTMTAEVTQKRRTASGAWDKGGAPALLENGHVQIVEGFRFPPDFPQESLPDFSTNNMVFTASAVDRDVPLDRYLVKKKVDGRPALQLETITCEASGSLGQDGRPVFDLGLLRVPREGPSGRFFPVKEPVDLETQRGNLKERLFSGWRLRDGDA